MRTGENPDQAVPAETYAITERVSSARLGITKPIAPPYPRQRSMATMHKPTALVIEDDRDMANIFAVVLRTAGVEAKIVYAGDEALAWLADLAPDLVLLDLHIPRPSGVDIVHRIRGDERLSGTQIVVVTGDPRAAEDIQHEADLVLIKPVSFDQLQNLVTRLIPGG